MKPRKLGASQHLFNQTDSASALAHESDERWFAENPDCRCRVRPLRTGESPVVDRLIEAGAASRAYAIVIHHARAKDKRAEIGIGTYPVFVTEADPEPARKFITREARHMVRHFRKSPKTPRPSQPGGSMSKVRGNA